MIIVIPEGCLFHQKIYSNGCLSNLDNGLWSVEFVMYPQSMQFVCWSFVTRCLTKFHLCTGTRIKILQTANIKGFSTCHCLSNNIAGQKVFAHVDKQTMIAAYNLQ